MHARREEDNMSFLDIKDPQKRDEIVQDYIKTLSLIRAKAENEKAKGLEQQIQLEKQYNPIIKATKESTDKIANELKNNRAIVEDQKEGWKPNFSLSAVDYYLKLKKNRDKYYGIQKINGQYKMGLAIVTLDDKSNIYVNNVRFQGTEGLWSLVMLNQPSDYTQEDLHNYEELVDMTQVIDNPLIKTMNDRPQTTTKYKNILSQFLEDDDDEFYETHDEGKEKLESDDDDNQQMIQEGHGITYLPGNIKGLLDRLKLVYAEREAGNILATTNEIVGILDELLRIGYIDRTEYNAVCKQLSC